MSTISDKYADIFEDIIDHISKEEEKDYATHKLNELTSLFLDMIEKATKLNGERIDDLEESQKKLKKKFDKMYETLQLIKKDIYEDETEKLFAHIESRVANIIDQKILKHDTITLTRKELLLLKRYMLICQLLILHLLMFHP